MSPPYIFRIDEIRESPNAFSQVDRQGHWIPPVEGTANMRVNEGVTGIWWYCNGQSIQALPPQSIPSSPTFYSTYSMYYSGGRGFHVLRGDATNVPADEAWHPLRFDYDDAYSSFVTNAGQWGTLQWYRNDQIWPWMLFPDIYIPGGPQIVEQQAYGGLRGELPIFLGLMAFSTLPNQLQQWIPAMFTGATWRIHQWPNGRLDRRGVVVYVYTIPPTWPNGNLSTARELERYENGVFNNYFH